MSAGTATDNRPAAPSRKDILKQLKEMEDDLDECEITGRFTMPDEATLRALTAASSGEHRLALPDQQAASTPAPPRAKRH